MYKRYIQESVEAFLKVMPVVLLTGARQSGKTTLVEAIARERGYNYFTLDDELSLSNAHRDPSGWLMSLSKPVVIDEIQRVPELFLSIKRDVDQNRQAGRYLLTGSANPLLIPKLGDSLAGRMGIVSLFPFSQSEIVQKKDKFIEHLFAEKFLFQKFETLTHNDFCKILLKGGFPAVQPLQDLQDVRRWVSSYLQTMMERDVRDIAQIEGIREFPRLFRLLACRSSMLLNVADISRSLGMVTVTVNRYLRLLEILYFIYLLPAWYTNLGKRMVKSAKLHICDTAVLAQLLEIDETRIIPSFIGQFLENFVFSELQKQKSWSSLPFTLYHFRDGDYEVDFILERPDGSIVAIEVKSTKTLHSDDFRGLKYLQTIAKNRFKRGIVLHLGSQIESIGNNLFAVPLQSLWS